MQRITAFFMMAGLLVASVFAADPMPDDGLFMPRNTGNQIATAEGAVEYGYAEAVLTGKLGVIGAHDYRKDLRQGYGNVQIINVHGETNLRPSSPWT